jgi:hypothetical protein
MVTLQSIMDVVLGVRKAPAPVRIEHSRPTFTTLQPTKSSTPEPTKPSGVIDYFDFED